MNSYYCFQGLVSYSDFRRVFQLSEEDVESRGLGAEAGGSFEAIPPKMIPEIVELAKVIFLWFLVALHLFFFSKYIVSCEI